MRKTHKCITVRLFDSASVWLKVRLSSAITYHKSNAEKFAGIDFYCVLLSKSSCAPPKHSTFSVVRFRMLPARAMA